MRFEDLPYRPCVGVMVLNRAGHVLIGRRIDGPEHVDETHAWQMPQGGIDPGEDPRLAVMRELEEETGIAQAEILAEHPEWIDYDLPPHLIGAVLGGKYRGQRQRWFALRFLGQDSDIRLDAHTHPEFVEWKWVPLEQTPEIGVPFKRATYERLVKDFAEYSGRPGALPLHQARA
jgi:putative (di)nucleoside polyphosphate hydrolase